MKSIRRCLAIIVFAITAVGGIAAQSVRDVERAENERDLALRSWNLRLLQLQHDKAKNRKPLPRQALAQLQDDFVHLQIANKSMLRAVLIDHTLDPKFIGKSASEIKKRAERLNTNLALPDTEGIVERSESEINAEQLKPSVEKLGRLIFSFVDNPFFKEASVVDTQQTAKARRDLEEIIQLSERIKKSSDRLRKN
jgi:hypothetical protein